MRRGKTVYVTFYILIATVSALNYEKLMKEYFLLCGPDYFCLPPNETHKFTLIPDKKYTYLNLCPECQCDSACVSRGDCCADVYFKLPELKCVNRTIISAAHDKRYERNSLYLMVNKCPTGTRKEMKQKCEGVHDTDFMLQNLPVYDIKSNISYRNSYCAECNNIPKYFPWDLDIHCEHFADFNFLSTLKEVIDFAHRKHCVFQAFERNENTVDNVKNCGLALNNTYMITKCNETTHWEIKDPDIKDACESSFVGRYKSSKNVFCYMCNPSNVGVPKDICNETGVWKPFDEGIQNACQVLPASEATFPYKNVFCYICNRDNFQISQTFDIFSNFSETLYTKGTMKHTIKVQTGAVNLNLFNRFSSKTILNSARLKKPKFKVFSKDMMNLKGHRVDLRHLFSRYLELSKNISLCPARRFLLNSSSYDTDCMCDPFCVFDSTRSMPCCHDSSLELPVRCIKSDELSSPLLRRHDDLLQGHLVVDGCLQHRTTELFNSYCGIRTHSVPFSLLPFNNVKNNASFQNLYCVLCNLNTSSYISLMMGEQENDSDSTFLNKANIYDKAIREFSSVSDQYKPWSLIIYCNKYVDYSHYPLLSELIKLMQSLGCKITYLPPKTRPCLSYRKGCKGDRLKFSDKAVKHACSAGLALDPWIPKRMKYFCSSNFYVKMYSNTYCAHCSYNATAFSFEDTIDVCNVTGLWNTSDNYTEYMCSAAPLFPYYFPFKNEFCASCNTHLYSYKAPGWGDGKGAFTIDPVESINIPIPRDMFRIDFEDDQNIKRHRNCEINQINDMFSGTCRSILCYPGKYLKNLTCTSLLYTTKNLRYGIAFGISSPENITENTEENIYKASRIAILRKLGLKNITIHVHEIHSFLNDSKGEGLGSNIYIELFISESIVRVETERHLVNFVSTNSTVNVSGYVYNIFPSVQAYSLVKKHNATSYKNRRSLKYDFRMYRLARTSRLLLCTQIALYSDEYRIISDQNRTYLILNRNGAILEHDEYDILPKGNVRVCIDTLNKVHYFEKAVSNMEIILFYTNISGSALSVICLLLFLITYALFPNLRTTAGKLMLILVSSLLLTLIFTSLSFFFLGTTLGCTMVGILLHFFWLVVFSSMQVCSFHMFKQFHSSTPLTFRPGILFTNRLCLYSIYIVFLPVSIVLLHIVSSVLHTNNIGYGGTNCFISDPIAKIFSFVVPVILICVSNLYFFVSTTVVIHRTPSPRSNQETRGELQVCIRLSTITGISWLFQIFDSFFPMSVLTFIATVICCLQGLFIFLAFIANKRILTLYKGFLREKMGKIKSSSSSNNVTTTNTKVITSKVTKL